MHLKWFLHVSYLSWLSRTWKIEGVLTRIWDNYLSITLFNKKIHSPKFSRIRTFGGNSSLPKKDEQDKSIHYPSFGVLYSLDPPPLMSLTPLSCVLQMLLDKHIVRDALDIQHDRRVIPITPLGWIIDWLKANTVLVHFVLGAWSQSWEPVDVEEGSWSLQWASESPNTLDSELILCLYTRRVYLYITVLWKYIVKCSRFQYPRVVHEKWRGWFQNDKDFRFALWTPSFVSIFRENVLPLDRGISFPVGVCISWSLCKPRDVTLYSSGPLRSPVSVFSVSPLSIRIFVFCKVIVSNFASATYMYNVHCTPSMSGISAKQYYNPVVSQ